MILGTMGNRQRLSFSPDRTGIAAVTQTDGDLFSSDVKVWEVDSGQQVASFPMTIGAGVRPSGYRRQP